MFWLILKIKFNKMERKEYIEYNGKKYAVAYRQKGKNKIDFCPFCNHEHSHGVATDNSILRNYPLCKDGKYFESIKASDGTILYQEDGYIIIEY